VLLTAAAVLGTAWFVVLSPTPAHVLALTAAMVLGGVPAVAGLAVSRRLGHSLLGALVVLPGLLAAVVLCASLAPQDVSPPGDAYLVAAGQGDWVLVYLVLAVPLLFFPEGRPATRGARWLLALIMLDAATFMVTAATAPGPFLPPDEHSPHVLGTMPGWLADLLSAVTLPGLLVGLGAIVLHLVRLHRTGDEPADVADQGGMKRERHNRAGDERAATVATRSARQGRSGPAGAFAGAAIQHRQSVLVRHRTLVPEHAR